MADIDQVPPAFHVSWPVIATSAALAVSTLFMLAAGVATAQLGHDLVELARLQVVGAAYCGNWDSAPATPLPPRTSRRLGT